VSGALETHVAMMPFARKRDVGRRFAALPPVPVTIARGASASGVRPLAAVASASQEAARMDETPTTDVAETARQSWAEICQQDELQGRWVALDGAVYDESPDRPSSGMVVDADDDPAELCNRLRESKHRHCAVHYVDED